MDLRRLREFIVLAENLNFSRAAEQLFITQPVLSRHIADLESELGVQLFIRTKHKVQLTALGALFFQECKKIVSQYDEACQKMRMASAGIVGSLKIGFLDRAVKKFFSKLITHFNSIYPKIHLDFYSYDLEELTRALMDDEIDLGFTLSLTPENIPGINRRTIYQDILCAVVHREHALAGKSNVTLAGLADESIIMLNRNQNARPFEHTMMLFETRNLQPNVVRETSTIESAFVLVELGTGIFIAPRHHFVNANQNVRFVNLEDDDCSIDIVVTWKENNPNPSILPFLKEIDVAHNNFLQQFIPS